MRRAHRIVLLLALLIGGAGMNYVQAAVYSGSCGTNATWSLNTINYKLTISGSGAMTNYTSSSPAPWDSYKTSILTISIANTITSIGDYAFAQCRRIISVSIGTGVTSIGSYAFSECTLLTSARLPNGVTTIGNAAFYNCPNLSYVYIPSSVTSLGSQAFYGCTKLTSITIPNSVTKLGTYTLSGSGIVDIYVYWTTTSGDHCIPVWTTGFVTKVPQTAVTLHVPCGTRSMYMGLTGWRNFTVVEPQYTITAQTNNSSYGTVKIDDGTAGADVSKTVNCATSVTLTAVTTTTNCNIDFLQWNDGNKDNPRTITAERSITYTAQFGTIGGDCGANGNNLTWAFNRCTGVLTISGTGAMADYERTGDNCAEYSSSAPWIAYKASITSIVLSYGLTHIGSYAFYQCRGITDIDLPAALLSIGGDAFAETGLQQVCLPEGVTTIGNNAFGYMCFSSNSTPLKRVYLPNSLTSIGTNALSFNPLRCLTYPASANSFSTPYRGAYPANEVYASWKTNVPSRLGRVESIGSPKRKMHIPYGTTALYQAKDWARIYQLVEDVDERAIDLGLSIRWASCNVGATAPEESGEYYMWADTLGGWDSYVRANYPYYKNNQYTRYNATDHRTRLIPFDDVAYIRWGETWRMPTKDEWHELFTQCTWEKEKLNDVWVYKVTGPNGNYIYIPLPGYIEGTFHSPEADGYYWTSELYSTGSPISTFITSGGTRNSGPANPSYGRSVRAVYRREWPSFTLTITDTPEGTSYTKAVNAAGTYTLTAQEDDCHRFVRWSDGNTNKTRTVTVTANATYTAVYETIQYTVTVQAADPTMGDVSIVVN